MRNLLLLAVLLLTAIPTVRAETAWIEGEHYFLVDPVQPTEVAHGKVEVVEVFSYACPACNLFYPVIDQVKAALPANAQLRYLPASWHPEEDWKTFQRAFFAAQALGLVERTHEKVFDAIWKSGELATMDRSTNRPKQAMPTLVDAAAFYGRLAGVSTDDFLTAAHSFAVDAKMREADAQIRAYGVDATPSLVINGRYRLTPRSAGGNDQFIALTKWLVAKEAARHQP
jgi:thiol:disulfide interchange protein DsbA